MMHKTDKAIHFATEAFAGKTRKCSGQPAILHALEAAVIVSSMTNDEDTIAAAVLHDVIEDAGVRAGALEAEFGSRVTELVLFESEDKRTDLPADKTWRIRKEEVIRRLEKTDDTAVKMLFLGDKLSNMRSLYNDIDRVGETIWQNFNQKNPQAHHWYYRTIADSMPELQKYPAWQEYDRLIEAVFHENEGSLQT